LASFLYAAFIGRNSPREEKMQKMNYWGEKWDLHVDICPCDVHFNEWVEANKMGGRTIYHFGTGTHHVIGRRQAELGNAVFAITASKEEYDAYVTLVSADTRIARSYVAHFGDIYLSNPRLLPEFDIVTMFHLCEFSHANTASTEYGGLTDRGFVEVLGAAVEQDMSTRPELRREQIGQRASRSLSPGPDASRSSAWTISRRCWFTASIRT
jgi:hypothetical protein